MQLIDEAEQYIRSELAHGPRLFRDLKNASGFSERTLQRAALRLDIRRSRDGVNGPWRWSLDEAAHLFAPRPVTVTKEEPIPCYQIEQDMHTGRWLITNSRDQNLIWGGSSWLYRDQGAAPLITFADRASAERYGERILGGE